MRSSEQIEGYFPLPHSYLDTWTVVVWQMHRRPLCERIGDLITSGVKAFYSIWIGSLSTMGVKIFSLPAAVIAVEGDVIGAVGDILIAVAL